MSDSVKQRLIGAIVLLIVAVCLWPVVFKPVENPDVVLRSKIPAAPELQVFEIPRQQAPANMPDVAAEIESQRPDIGNVKQAESIGEDNMTRVEEPELAEMLDLTAGETVADIDDPIGDIATSDEVAEIAVPTEPKPTDSKPTEPQSSQSQSTNEATAPDVAQPQPKASQVRNAPESDTYDIKDATTPATKATPDGPMWALQAGAFGDASNAERLADELREKNFSVVVQRRFGATRMLAFVMVGPYFNLDNARTGIIDLQNAGYKSTLVEFAP